METGTVFFTESKFVENKKFIPENIEIPIFIHRSIDKFILIQFLGLICFCFFFVELKERNKSDHWRDFLKKNCLNYANISQSKSKFLNTVQNRLETMLL